MTGKPRGGRLPTSAPSPRRRPLRPRASVVITGAAHGIGSALAERFARAGHRVAVLDLDEAAARARVAALDTSETEAIALACDVTSPAACSAAMDTVCAAWGGVDVLVNNAGITHVGPVLETDVDVLRRVMEVNFFGAVHATRAALPSLLERGGRVAAMSSVAGFAPLATRAGYVASKHALEGFFATLRAEHAADGLGVTLVAASFVRTEIGSRALGTRLGEPAPARSGVGREIEVETAARIIHTGIERGLRRIWVGREARLARWVSQLAPHIYERSMLRRTVG